MEATGAEAEWRRQAVHRIDREASAVAPTLELDFVDLYEGDDSFSRKLLTNPGDWDETVVPALRDAARVLETYRVRHIHVAGSLRHPMWFAVGRALPEVKKWTLSVDQVGPRGELTRIRILSRPGS